MVQQFGKAKLFLFLNILNCGLSKRATNYYYYIFTLKISPSTNHLIWRKPKELARMKMS